MYAGGIKQVLYKEYICWIQVKIHISDQTSLRICNSVYILYTIVHGLAVKQARVLIYYILGKAPH